MPAEEQAGYFAFTNLHSLGPKEHTCCVQRTQWLLWSYKETSNRDLQGAGSEKMSVLLSILPLRHSKQQIPIQQLFSPAEADWLGYIISYHAMGLWSHANEFPTKMHSQCVFPLVLLLVQLKKMMGSWKHDINSGFLPTMKGVFRGPNNKTGRASITWLSPAWKADEREGKKNTDLKPFDNLFDVIIVNKIPHAHTFASLGRRFWGWHQLKSILSHLCRNSWKPHSLFPARWGQWTHWRPRGGSLSPSLVVVLARTAHTMAPMLLSSAPGYGLDFFLLFLEAREMNGNLPEGSMGVLVTLLSARSFRYSWSGPRRHGPELFPTYEQHFLHWSLWPKGSPWNTFDLGKVTPFGMGGPKEGTSLDLVTATLKRRRSMRKRLVNISETHSRRIKYTFSMTKISFKRKITVIFPQETTATRLLNMSILFHSIIFRT